MDFRLNCSDAARRTARFIGAGVRAGNVCWIFPAGAGLLSRLLANTVGEVGLLADPGSHFRYKRISVNRF